MSGPTPAEPGATDDELLELVRQGMRSGSIDRDELARLVAAGAAPPSGRASAAIVAVGIVIAYAGSALLYAVEFSRLPHGAQLVTPWVFPAASLAVAVALTLRRRPAWEREAAFAVGYASLAGAAAASVSAVRSIDAELVLAGISAATSVAIGAGLLRWPPGRAAVSYWALGVSVGVFALSGAWAIGVTESDQRWVMLALGAAGAGAATIAIRSAATRAAGSTAALATAALVLASMVGATQGAADELTPWHGLLTGVVVAAVLLGLSRRLPELVAAGALGTLFWLSLAGSLVSREPLWAVVVIAFGVLLAASSALVMRRR